MLSQGFMCNHFIGRSEEYGWEREVIHERKYIKQSLHYVSYHCEWTKFLTCGEILEMVQNLNLSIILAKEWKAWYTPYLSMKGCLWWDIIPCHICHHILGKVGSYWCRAIMQWRWWEGPREACTTPSFLVDSILPTIFPRSELSSKHILQMHPQRIPDKN